MVCNGGRQRTVYQGERWTDMYWCDLRYGICWLSVLERNWERYFRTCCYVSFEGISQAGYWKGRKMFMMAKNIAREKAYSLKRNYMLC